MDKTNGKNPHAVALGKKRWEGVSKTERKRRMAAVQEALRLARETMGPERRSEIARLAGLASAAERKKAAVGGGNKKSRRKAKPRKG